MKINKAKAVWKGDLKSGNGEMGFEKSGTKFPFSFVSRFKDGEGANPEMLIGAAHAGCFSMAFSNMLSEAGFKPIEVNTVAEVKLDMVDESFKIIGSHLKVVAEVPEITDEEFQEIAAKAKAGCPVSQALSSIDISLDARLK